MIDIALDSLNRRIVKNGEFVQVEGYYAVAQAVRTRLNTIMGEWFLIADYGVPYFQDIFGKNRNLDDVNAIFKTIILETEGVNQLLSYTSSLDSTTRTYSVSFKINTDYGDIESTDVSTI